MTAPGSRLPDVSTVFPVRAWLDDRALRSWTTWLFVALVAVPPLAFVLFRSASGWGGEATTFALYFAAAWFLVLWVVVRPQNVRGAMLAQVAVIALIVEFPLAYGLETVLGPSTDNVLASIVSVGVPEELAKMVPVVALVLWQRRSDRRLPPRDVLFLGAISGLAFGAVEAIEYVTSSPASGTGAALNVVWRLLTDPISHACWAGVSGYFLGLASYYREPGPWAALAAVGLGVPAVLHGINDVVAGSAMWIVVAVLSTLIFLAYARVGIAPRPTPASGPGAPVPSAPPPPRHRAAGFVPHSARTTPDPVTTPIPLGTGPR